MAEAVMSLFPEGKLAIGPPTDDGFYYDFDLPRALTPEDLQQIESRMRETIARNVPFERRVINREEARHVCQSQPFKLELLDSIPEGEPISLYTHGSFTDLCEGPHVARTGDLKAFKLLSIAGAYWRGDEHRPMLQRIYGTAFESQDELKAHLHRLEEAAKRDHRKLGKELDLFSVHEETGAGLVLWHPKGARIRTIIEDFWRSEHYHAEYEMSFTPHMGKAQLWQTSGHLDFYAQNMYAPMDIEGQQYYIKPMNCPFHIMVYGSRLRSYRELPIRIAELGTVYRFERGGVLHGLLRVRGFTQDDAHIFCRPDQVEDEVVKVLDLTLSMLRTFGFTEYEVYLATRPDKFVGRPEDWEMATEALRRAVAKKGLEVQVDEGGGAFYGPKIDLKIKDALNRSWQCSTVQFDFNLPERFNLTYQGEDGKEHRPVMVHRALLGSIERFFGVLVEHFGGAFPVWLAPVQAVVIPIADRHNDYARQVASAMKAQDLRVQIDERKERMNGKIRDAQLQKVPYMLILGDEEVNGSTVSVRTRRGENRKGLPLADFIAQVRKAVQDKALE
ncbi:MAG: threonine--tRNA ligase [Chloroflexota bacterium]